MSAPESLRLLAEDADDLAVISAALQDALTKPGDIKWERQGRRLTIGFDRFRWEAPESVEERVRAGFQLGGVLGVQARNLRHEADDVVLELLMLTFEPSDPPSGRVTFTFAGGGDLAAEVECIDAALADLSPPWPAPRPPEHDA